jgi:SAM-dependent methyltransferase
MNSIEVYLRGERLYGDDFTPEQIAEWYADEAEGYANLGAGNAATYSYGYHAWNRYHAYRHLGVARLAHVLGFGSAYGDELLPIAAMADRITIVDPSDAFANPGARRVVEARHVKPGPGGTLPFARESFDLITCFGVLHHVPNVSFVVSELARVLKTGGTLALREPIVSMGDWRFPRRGVTKRERGIPVAILDDIIGGAGLTIERKTLCGFPAVSWPAGKLRWHPYNSMLATVIDAWLSRLFAWNVRYHARGLFQRVRPTAAFYLLSRRPAPDA